MSDESHFRASQDLFDDSLPLEESETRYSGENRAWRGVELNSLRVDYYELIPSVTPSSYHSVLFKLPIQNGKCPEPYPEKYLDTWDTNHVQMPCSKKNLFQLTENEFVPAWPLIKNSLSVCIGSGKDLEDAIINYAWKGENRWNFKSLHKFLSETLEEGERDYFFDHVLPGIVDLALSIDKEVTCGLPLLRSRKSYNISLTQRQVACLLANAFLCTFPKRNFARETPSYPTINFTRLFLQGTSLSLEKLKCIINYFRRVCDNTNLDGVITFSRRSMNPANLPSWCESKKLFTKLHITSEGTIEDDGQGMINIDFANKLVGGGVLGRGAVQEEITFLLCPELIISRLFTECLDDTEALIITGVERFNKHTGYAENFKWAGNYDDRDMPRDSYRRKCRTIVALDALRFSNTLHQYKPAAIFRDINKAYCGFSFGCDGRDKLSIATGNWGCGAFRGDPHLKALIQLIAASQSDRNMTYFTFYNNDLRDTIYDLYSFLVRNDITVGQLCSLLNRYHVHYAKVASKNKELNSKVLLYDFLYSSLLDLDKESSGQKPKIMRKGLEVGTSKKIS